MIEMHRELELLGAYALGALTEAEAAELTVHLEGCPLCRRELAELQQVRDLLDELPPEVLLDGPPSDGDLLLQRTLRQVREEERATVTGRGSGVADGRRRWLVALAAAGAAVVLAGGGILLGQRQPGQVVQAGPTVTTTAPAPTPSLPPGTRTVSATDPQTGATLAVTIKPAAGWVRLSAKVGGIPEGEECRLIVVGADGVRETAGSWLVSAAGEKDGTALESFALVAPAEVESVVVENFAGETFVTATV